MALLSELITKFQYAADHLEEEVGRAIEINKEDIYALISINQLARGEDGFGQPLYNSEHGTDSYSYSYQKSNYRDAFSSYGFPKREGDRFNFSWSGGYVDNLRYEYSNSSLLINSIDYKANKLDAVYGQHLTTMNPDNQETLKTEILSPHITKWILSL